ncbi:MULTISPECIES: hypothetical protein [Actinomycetes]|uniref:T3SS (YopN, CesT) and YbjN peptide-binding chaperone 1 n=2 Tax=Actinomycetes TaxID=1760 RepID=UPI0004C130D8|nr:MULTISPECIES: hypothetical protein [Actinomycetes]
MTMSNIFDFDASVSDGWAAFRDELTTCLTGLQADGSVRVTAPSSEVDGAGPAAVFTINDDDEVRCHLSPTILGQGRELSDDELSLLMALEWDSICEDECIVECSRDEAERVVLAATGVMQELWQVLHPSFLLTVEEQPAKPIQHTGFQPAGQTQLQDLVDASLERMTGSAPHKDDDGDITFTVNDETSWLCVDVNDPVIEMFTNLAVDVDDSAAASAAIMDFSRKWPDIKFVLVDSYVRVSIRMDATVFTDAVLRSTMTKWFEFLTEGSGDVAAVVTEARSAAEDADESLPAGLMCLLQLDDDDVGPLTTREIAAVCDFDRDAILHYIKVCEEQRFSWRSSIYDALERQDEEEAAACEHEEKAWAATTKSLRAALRFVVLSGRLDGVR